MHPPKETPNVFKMSNSSLYVLLRTNSTLRRRRKTEINSLGEKYAMLTCGYSNRLAVLTQLLLLLLLLLLLCRQAATETGIRKEWVRVRLGPSRCTQMLRQTIWILCVPLSEKHYSSYISFFLKKTVCWAITNRCFHPFLSPSTNGSVKITLDIIFVHVSGPYLQREQIFLPSFPLACCGSTQKD